MRNGPPRGSAEAGNGPPRSPAAPTSVARRAQHRVRARGILAALARKQAREAVRLIGAASPLSASWPSLLHHHRINTRTAPHIAMPMKAVATTTRSRDSRAFGGRSLLPDRHHEHGLKMARLPRAGVEPAKFAEQMSPIFKQRRRSQISYDRLIRTPSRPTTMPRGDLSGVRKRRPLLGRYEGWYSVRARGLLCEDELSRDSG